MRKEDLRIKIKIKMSSATLAQHRKNEIVSMNELMRICKALNCNVGDIIDYINEVKK